MRKITRIAEEMLGFQEELVRVTSYVLCAFDVKRNLHNNVLYIYIYIVFFFWNVQYLPV